MDQQPHPGVAGPAGRRLHIAHRRSPSEMTPLLSRFSQRPLIVSMCHQAMGHSQLLCKHVADWPVCCSGTTRFAATNRTSSATATTNRWSAPAICADGHDPSTTTTTNCQLSPPASDARTICHGRHVTPRKCIPIPAATPATAAGGPNERTNTACIAPP